MYLRNVILAALVSAIAAFAQNPITADSPFQVRYAANLLVGESYINITNTGANGATLNGPGLGSAGNICVNVYAFDPGEELISCCSCLVTPDQTISLGVNANLLANTLTFVKPTSVTVKLLATLAGTGGTGTSCTNSAATATAAVTPPVAGSAVTGMAAWGTTLHAFSPLPPLAPGTTYATTETSFTPSTLSGGELASITNRCTGIIGNGSLHGQCVVAGGGTTGVTTLSCGAGALGAGRI